MSLPKLPTEVLVLGQPFRIELVPDLKSVDGDPIYGECAGALHRIRVSADQNIERQWQTLMHEYVHAVFHVAGIGNVLSEEVEEIAAQSLEYGWRQLQQQFGKALVKIFTAEKHQ